ncbi:Protein transport protein Sec61 subunit gamma [Rhynchospora pubera]|uniref:Protein transport protein Sec61 subunit gamma n=1 Tax=Rhynchospora pubera TaxID=906938 RepID=A0AAV8FKN6_9POAL|nr:Protein transport protein Sec61 subunit gamma [Rhynchospora pubera]
MSCGPSNLKEQTSQDINRHRTLFLSSLLSKEEKKKESRKMDAIDSVVDPLREFAKDSIRLVKRCHKPDRKGFFPSPFRFKFSKVAVRTAIGFVVMGFVGFFVKLIFIPINNIIVGSG